MGNVADTPCACLPGPSERKGDERLAQRQPGRPMSILNGGGSESSGTRRQRARRDGERGRVQWREERWEENWESPDDDDGWRAPEREGAQCPSYPNSRKPVAARPRRTRAGPPAAEARNGGFHHSMALAERGRGGDAARARDGLRAELAAARARIERLESQRDDAFAAAERAADGRAAAERRLRSLRSAPDAAQSGLPVRVPVRCAPPGRAPPPPVSDTGGMDTFDGDAFDGDVFGGMGFDAAGNCLSPVAGTPPTTPPQAWPCKAAAPLPTGPAEEPRRRRSPPIVNGGKLAP